MTTPPQRVADALVALAGVGDGAESVDVSVLLATTLADRTHQVVGADACAVVLAPESEGQRTRKTRSGSSPAPSGAAAESWQVVSSHPGLRQLERDATRWGEGPAPDCLRRRASLPPIALDSTPTRTRWPRYSARAKDAGFSRVAVLLLSGARRPIGAVVLLSTGADTMSRQALELGRSLADVASRSLVHEAELRRSRIRVAQLEHALASRIVIEQAKGVIAAQLSATMDDAFALLRAHARTHGRLLPEVAREVIDGKLAIGTGQAPGTRGGAAVRTSRSATHENGPLDHR
ncbi:ANTAR domain-containing protein [Streptomyces sp. NPDC059070]|uniref:ANTAR domain-containing protein n=1 Tax=Streptomyces sp. NPDC059070 TaxID=3346713 RepID=UPI00368567AE